MDREKGGGRREGGIEGVLEDERRGRRMNEEMRDGYKMRKGCVNVKVYGGLKVLRKDGYQDGRMNEGGKG